jgi:hypothetical protein
MIRFTNLPDLLGYGIASVPPATPIQIWCNRAKCLSVGLQNVRGGETAAVVHANVTVSGLLPLKTYTLLRYTGPPNLPMVRAVLCCAVLCSVRMLAVLSALPDRMGSHRQWIYHADQGLPPNSPVCGTAA